MFIFFDHLCSLSFATAERHPRARGRPPAELNNTSKIIYENVKKELWFNHDIALELALQGSGQTGVGGDAG